MFSCIAEIPSTEWLSMISSQVSASSMQVNIQRPRCRGHCHIFTVEELICKLITPVSSRQRWLRSVYGRKNTGRREPGCSGRAGRKELTGQGRQGENVEETGNKDKLIKNTGSYQEEMGGQLWGNTNKTCDPAETLLLNPQFTRACY